MPDATFRIHPPRTLRDLVRVQSRVRAGNSELAQRVRERGPDDARAPWATITWLASRLAVLLGRPRLWSAVPLHAAIYVAVRVAGGLQHRRGDRSWLRDESSRTVERSA